MQLLRQFIAAILPLSQLPPPAWQGFCLTDCVSTGSCDTASRIFPLLPWLLIQALHAAASNLQLLRVMLLFRLPRLLLTCCEANCVCSREVLSAASSAAALNLAAATLIAASRAPATAGLDAAAAAAQCK